MQQNENKTQPEKREREKKVKTKQVMMRHTIPCHSHCNKNLWLALN